MVKDFVQPQFSFLTTALGQLACLAPQMFMSLTLLFLLNLGYAIVSSITLRCKLIVVSFADAA